MSYGSRAPRPIRRPFARGRGGPGGWRILAEPELHLGDDALVPDLAGWRLETSPELVGGAWVLRGGASEESDARLMPFDAISFDVAAIWP